MNSLITTPSNGIIRISPSKLPLFWFCGQAILGSQNVGRTTEASRSGSAVHDGVSLMERGLDVDLHWIGEKHSVADFDDLEKMYAYGVVAWHDKGLKDKFLPASFLKVEYPLELNLAPNIILTGTTDLSWAHERIVKIADWKTGRIVRPAWKQLLGYLLLQLESMRFYTDDAELKEYEFYAIVIWLRHWFYETNSYSYDQIMEFKEELISKVSNPDPQYTRNDDCEYCPRYLTDCPIIPAETRNIALAVADIENFDFDTHADKVPEIDAKVKILANLCDKWKELRNARLRRGPIELPDNRYMILDHQTKRHISNVKRAKDILSDYLPENEVWEFLSLSLSKAEKQIRGNAQKGHGSASVRSFNRGLEEAGIISKVPFRSLPKIIQKELEDGKQ